MKSISDVIGASGLHGYAEVALIIFFAVFVAVVLRTFSIEKRELEQQAQLPLDDAPTSHRSAPAND